MRLWVAQINYPKLAEQNNFLEHIFWYVYLFSKSEMIAILENPLNCYC